MYDKVFLNEYGFYELKKKPSLSSMKKDLLMKLDWETPGTKERMFHAIVTGNIYDWVDPKITDTRKN